MAEELKLPIVYTPEFREVNNGDLVGMKNELAEQRYPGLYWSALGFAECYPNGESKRQEVLLEKEGLK